MSHEQTIELLGYIKAALPDWGKELKSTDAKNMVVVWQDLFNDFNFEIVMAATKSCLDEKPFFPKPSDIKSKYRLILSNGKHAMTENEAWALVKNASSNALYNAKTEFDKLPEEIRAVLGTHVTLRDYAMADVQTLSAVQGSNFMRSYRARMNSVNEYNSLSDSVKAIASELAGRLSIDSKRDSGEETENGEVKL